MTKGITRRGFIPNCASAYHIQSDDRSQPPVGSLIVLEIYKRHPERWFLRRGLRRIAAVESMVADGARHTAACSVGAPMTCRNWWTERSTTFRPRSSNRAWTTHRCMTACPSIRGPTCWKSPMWGSMRCMSPIAGRWKRCAAILGREEETAGIARARRPIRRGAGDSVGREVGHVPESAHGYRRGIDTAFAH